MKYVSLVYAITIIASLIVAVILVQFARMTTIAKAKSEKLQRDKGLSVSGIQTDESLRHTIYEEINEGVNSKAHPEELTKRVSDVVTMELKKRTEKVSHEIRSKYESIIERKDQSEDMAWKKYKKTLADKKETEAVIRSIAEGLVVVDAKGKVVMMNPSAEKLLGESGRDKLGRPILEGLNDEQIVSLSKNSPTGAGKEIELISQDDETKKVIRSSTAVIENENGQTVGMVSVLSDITKQKELDRMKSEFVANVTHELRTPLVAIHKAIGLLLQKTAGPVSDTQEEFLNLADRNLKKLSVLINDLLDLSKLEAGRLEIKREPTSIESVIDECAASLSSWMDAKAIKFEKKVQPGLPEVNIDSVRINQVLTNLIGNAIKFTPNEGSITVEAFAKEDANEIVVSVLDTGIGMSKEDTGKIFDKFYQAGERAPTDIAGTGIGLSISKEITELHGGKIWAESEKGSGAKFIFTIPL